MEDRSAAKPQPSGRAVMSILRLLVTRTRHNLSKNNTLGAFVSRRSGLVRLLMRTRPARQHVCEMAMP